MSSLSGKDSPKDMKLASLYLSSLYNLPVAILMKRQLIL